MAHPNIFERQRHVRRLLDQGVSISGKLKKELATQYTCSTSAIHADVVAMTRPQTSETPFQSAAMRKRIFDRDGRVCQYCGDCEAYEYIIEHVLPAALGGTARPHNLVVACQRCNTRKRRKVWIPKNFDEITKDNPKWKAFVMEHHEDCSP